MIVWHLFAYVLLTCILLWLPLPMPLMSAIALQAPASVDDALQFFWDRMWTMSEAWSIATQQGYVAHMMNFAPSPIKQHFKQRRLER